MNNAFLSYSGGFAVLDVGSNSVRAGIFVSGKLVSRTLITSRLGEGVENGVLKSESILRTVAAIKDLIGFAKEKGSEYICAFATEAVRRAANKPDFLSKVKAETGLEICVVSGEDEAELALTGALNGEDGTLAGLKKLSNIAFASPETFSSSLSMDKYYTKLVLKGIGVDTLPYVKLNRDNYIKRGELAEKYVSKTLDYPVIVKPANLGSSIGISVAKSEKDLKKSLEYAFRYDEKAIVETALTNFREINCACVKVCGKYVVSECEEPRFSGDILGFDDKYGGNREVAFPAEINVSSPVVALMLAIPSGVMV